MEKAAEAALDKYVNAITSKVPDQAYVTLDNTTIDTCGDTYQLIWIQMISRSSMTIRSGRV